MTHEFFWKAMYGTPFGRFIVGTYSWEKYCPRKIGEKSQGENANRKGHACSCQQMFATGQKGKGSQGKFGFDVGNSAKLYTFEDPTPLTDEVHLGCTQRAATVDEETIRTKTEMF